MVAPISACLSSHISRLSTTSQDPWTCCTCSRTRDPLGVLSMMPTFCLPVFIFHCYSFSFFFSFIVFHTISLSSSHYDQGVFQGGGVREEQKELMAVPSSGDRCKQKPAAVGGSSSWPYLPSHPTPLMEGGGEGHGTFSEAVPHHDNALWWVCLTGDTCCNSSSTSHLWAGNPFPLCRQTLSCSGSSTLTSSATAKHIHWVLGKISK